MRFVSTVMVLIIAAVLLSGCIQTTPATVKATEQTMVPTLLQTLFTTPAPTEYIRPTLAPIRTAKSKPAPVSAAPTKMSPEAIVGKWTLLGNSNYNCDATFRDDNSGGIVCSVGYITMSNEQVVWSSTDEEYSFMKSYSIRKLSDNRNYSMLYSYRKGTLTSEILPENTYLTRLK